MDRTGRPILLVSAVGYAHGWMPHGLGLIKAYLLKTTEFPVETASVCIRFSDYIREASPALAPYDRQMGEWGSSFHELYFAARYFGHAAPERLVHDAVVDYLQGGDIFRRAPWDEKRALRPALVEFHTARIMEFSRLVEAFSREELEVALRREPFLIGFSVTAQQLYTSAQMARWCREMCPSATIVFGGPAITTLSAGRILDIVPEADVIVLGDGEEAMRLIATAVAAQEPIPRASGVLQRGQKTLVELRQAQPPPLDEIPAPDWEELHGIIAGKGKPLTTWMGRGCSWGRCSFCSIPEFQRALFNRSPQRIVDDLMALSERYGTRRFRFGDWEVNGNSETLVELCKLLIERDAQLEFWAEVNARNLSSELLATMKRAGFVSLQVGIESFSSTLLRKMRKPAVLLDNVQALRHAHEHQIELFSNLLYNFPGETSEDIVETLSVIRRIRHLLRPPVTLALLEFLLETDADIFQQVEGADEHVGAPYRFEAACLPETLVEGGPYYLRRWNHPVDPRWFEVRSELERCRDNGYCFTHQLLDEDVMLVDGRDEKPLTHCLSATQALVYRALLDQKVTRTRLASALPGIATTELDQTLTAFVQAGWVLQDKQHFLALSVPRG